MDVCAHEGYSATELEKIVCIECNLAIYTERDCWSQLPKWLKLESGFHLKFKLIFIFIAIHIIICFKLWQQIVRRISFSLFLQSFSTAIVPFEANTKWNLWHRIVNKTLIYNKIKRESHLDCEKIKEWFLYIFPSGRHKTITSTEAFTSHFFWLCGHLVDGWRRWEWEWPETSDVDDNDNDKATTHPNKMWNIG